MRAKCGVSGRKFNLAVAQVSQADPVQQSFHNVIFFLLLLVFFFYFCLLCPETVS